MEEKIYYTTQLSAGLGLTDETKILLNIWEPGLDASALFQAALDSGEFANVSARRLKNIVLECFAPRYLADDALPAKILKNHQALFSSTEFNQLLCLYTCRANLILADFIRQVYWVQYSSGYDTLSNEDAKDFVVRAVEEGKTVKPWSESTIKKVSSYLTGCCSDFALLEKIRKPERKFIPFRLESKVAAILVHDLHFSGVGDNAAIYHKDWGIFGLEPEDVRSELKRLSLKNYLMIQSAGDVTRIGWNFKNMEEFLNVIAQGRF
ncbi:MAG: DUF1819 family protein [Desulfamplus sp.]|nr:DUF1819 family protein [Desulfamplus sp.]